MYPKLTPLSQTKISLLPVDFNLSAKISDIQFQGSLYKLLLEKDSILINAYYYPNSSNSINLEIGESINLSWDKINITDLNE